MIHYDVASRHNHASFIYYTLVHAWHAVVAYHRYVMIFNEAKTQNACNSTTTCDTKTFTMDMMQVHDMLYYIKQQSTPAICCLRTIYLSMVAYILFDLSHCIQHNN